MGVREHRLSHMYMERNLQVTAGTERLNMEVLLGSHVSYWFLIILTVESYRLESKLHFFLSVENETHRELCRDPI